MPASIEERAAHLVNAWLRGYHERERIEGRPLPPLALDELADLAFAARQAAERELAEGARKT